MTAVHVTDDLGSAEELRKRWEHTAPAGIPLVIIESPHRLLVEPLLAYVDDMAQAHGCGSPVVVVLPEVLPARWYERLLHRHTARRLRHALLHQAGAIVATVPFHLGSGQRHTRRWRCSMGAGGPMRPVTPGREAVAA